MEPLRNIATSAKRSGTVSDEELTEECSREFKEKEGNSENVAQAATIAFIPDPRARFSWTAVS